MTTKGLLSVLRMQPIWRVDPPRSVVAKFAAMATADGSWFTALDMLGLRVMTSFRERCLSRSTLMGIIVLTFIGLESNNAQAWLFEEHANIGRLATGTLPSRQAAALDWLWAVARDGDPEATRLCPTPGRVPTHDRTKKGPPDWDCVDFGALAAAAGDHSCSPDDLAANVLHSSWFPRVYADVAETERLLHVPDVSESARVDAWHQGNLILRRSDPEYLSRAANNSAHFVVGRGDEDDIADFLQRAAGIGGPVNATESYAAYHLGALAAAAKLYQISPAAPGYAAQAERVLMTEAFALHFLEDSFSAGHFVGMSPKAIVSLSDRAGTHDYYCQHGLEARLWGNGRLSYGAHGDAFMTEGKPSSDREIAAAAVRASLGQVLDVVAGAPLPDSVDRDADDLSGDDVCTRVVVSSRVASIVQRGTAALEPVLALTPEPYRQDPPLPHFRSEFGLLFRADAAYRLGLGFGGNFQPAQHDGAIRGESAAQLGAGIGLGLEGLTTQATDGVFWLAGNLIAYGHQPYFKCEECTGLAPRFGLGVRARIPFLVVPGDTILGLLVVLPFSSKCYEDMAIAASQGSLWGRIERVRPLGSAFDWQIVLGREAGFYRSHSNDLRVLQLELPLIEVRTKHQFAERLGNDALIQVGGAVEWDTVDAADGSRYTAHAWSTYVRLALDGMFYAYP